MKPFTDTTKPLRVVAYGRGSTEKQENTIEAQEGAVKRYCAALEFQLDRYFADSGISGSSAFMERPAVLEMLDYMKSEGITTIIFTKLDRAFRSVRDCVLTLDQWAAEGIAFHIIEQKIDTSNAMGRAFLQIMAVLAELENGQRSERQRAAFGVMRENGHRCGTIPYGWDAAPTSDRTSRTGRQADNLIPNEAEQIVLRRILAWNAEGISDNKIARLLNADGIPAKRGGAWHGATIASVRNHAKLAPISPMGSTGGSPVGDGDPAITDFSEPTTAQVA